VCVCVQEEHILPEINAQYLLDVCVCVCVCAGEAHFA